MTDREPTDKPRSNLGEMLERARCWPGWLQAAVFVSALALFALVVFPVVLILGAMAHRILDRGLTDDLQNFAFIYGAVLTAVFACWRAVIAGRQAKTAEENLKQTEKRTVTDNYVRALELLRDEDATVRLGGISVLERIARDNHKDYHIVVMNLFSGYVRSRLPTAGALDYPTRATSAIKDKSKLTFNEEDQARYNENPRGYYRGIERSDKPLEEDIVAILKVFANRTTRQRDFENELEYRIDLRGLNLQGIRYEGDGLAGTNLSFSRMELASLAGCNLDSTDLSHSIMTGAALSDVSLDRAVLANVKGNHCKLDRVQFQEANVYKFNLTSSDITGCHFIRCSGFGSFDLNDTQILRSLFWAKKDTPYHFPGVVGIDGKSIMNQCALRHVDLSAINNDNKTTFGGSFGDDSVKLPPWAERPPQFAPQGTILQDKKFFGLWRGWIEFRTPGTNWREIAPKGFEKEKALPPPDSCVR